LQTAIIFVSFVIAMDFFVAVILIIKSLVMFASLLRTWISLRSNFNFDISDKVSYSKDIIKINDLLVI